MLASVENDSAEANSGGGQLAYVSSIPRRMLLRTAARSHMLQMPPRFQSAILYFGLYLSPPQPSFGAYAHTPARL